MYISGRLATGEVIAAQRALLLALRDAIRRTDDLPRDAAEAALSSIFAGLWNDSEVMVRELLKPLPGRHRSPKS